MIVYRHADPRMPFLWESAAQPPGRWHGPDDGPVRYFVDTPDGAWAEFLRHEGITAESDLAYVRRAIWAVELPDELPAATPRLPRSILTGGVETYARCQKTARSLRRRGAIALRAPSAALVSGGARGWRVNGGLRPAAARDGTVLVLFGVRSDVVGWMAAFAASPHPDLLTRVRYL